MPRKGKFAKQRKILNTIQKYAKKREELKKAGDYAGLARLPRDASPTRYFGLCEITGRPRANYRKFRISRIMLRELAHEGKIPGMRKSSW